MNAQVVQLAARPSLRFKSWTPDHTDGSRATIVAGHEAPHRRDDACLTPARVLCLGPDEFLIVCREARNSNVPDRIAEDLAAHGLPLTDVTDELAAIELRGSLAHEVLASVCGLEIGSKAFAIGSCARVQLADVDVVIDYVADSPRFDLYFPRTLFAEFHIRLTNAAAELETGLTIPATM